MGLSLNGLSDERIQSDLKRKIRAFGKLQAKTFPPDSDAKARERHARKVGLSAFAVGTMLYQQEAPTDEVVKHLASAAEALLQVHEFRGPPESNANHQIWFFLRALYLVGIFGDERMAKRADGLLESSYRYPPRDDNALPALLAGQVKAFLAGKSLDHSICEEILSTCSAANASRDLRLWIGPLAAGLLSLSKVDVDGLDQALVTLLKSQEAEAKMGDYQDLADGFICLPALMLARLAIQRSMPISQSSLYLPLQLLE